MTYQSVFHEGELLMQAQAVVETHAARNGRIVVDSIDPNAVSFITQQTLIVLGSRDVMPPTRFYGWKATRKATSRLPTMTASMLN